MSITTVNLSQTDGNVVLTVNGEVVFCRPKTAQTIAIANTLYFGYKYKPREGGRSK